MDQRKISKQADSSSSTISQVFFFGVTTPWKKLAVHVVQLALGTIRSFISCENNFFSSAGLAGGG
jgi:hypothetical protein